MISCVPLGNLLQVVCDIYIWIVQLFIVYLLHWIYKSRITGTRYEVLLIPNILFNNN